MRIRTLMHPKHSLELCALLRSLANMALFRGTAIIRILANTNVNGNSRSSIEAQAPIPLIGMSRRLKRMSCPLRCHADPTPYPIHRDDIVPSKTPTPYPTHFDVAPTQPHILFTSMLHPSSDSAARHRVRHAACRHRALPAARLRPAPEDPSPRQRAAAVAPVRSGALLAAFLTKACASS